MPEGTRDIWITGVGIVSCLGEGAQAHLGALDTGVVRSDTEKFAPFTVFRLPPLDFDKQIPKKGDQRQMEPWQRIGTYAAGLALDDGGLKGNVELLARTDLIVAAAGGERDETVDAAILSGLPKSPTPETFLNERLMGDLRPTLFLAQLSNLLAGNISIVHGVTGSSRTLLGEETSGIDALRIGAARIASGQSDIVLAGGAQNAERKDLLMLYEMGGALWKGPPTSVWQREPQGGMDFGSMGAFLVLEASSHARARGVKPVAKLSRIITEWSRRRPGMVGTALRRMWDTLAPNESARGLVAISGATGVAPATAEERAFFADHPDVPVRATANLIGHGIEPQFPMNVALAASTLQRGDLFASHDGSGAEKAFTAAPAQAIVTGVGHWRGEGMALLERVE